MAVFPAVVPIVARHIRPLVQFIRLYDFSLLFLVAAIAIVFLISTTNVELNIECSWGLNN